MNKIQKLTLALASTIALSSPVFANEPVPTNNPPPHHKHKSQKGDKGEHKKLGEHLFIKADLDKNGSLSRQEMLAQASEYFDKVDLNKDGSVTREELQQAHQQMRKEHYRPHPEHHGKGKPGPQPEAK